MVADSKNTMWIGTEYFVSEGGDLWVMPDKDLIELGIQEMEGGAHKPCRRSRWLCSAHAKSLSGVFRQLRPDRHSPSFRGCHPNLFLIGRNGMHRYNNQDHSMLTAMLAVDNIICRSNGKGELLGCKLRWNITRRRRRNFKVYEYQEDQNSIGVDTMRS